MLRALGLFHIKLTLFSAFGKVIENSGGPYILNESDVPAKGPVNGFVLDSRFVWGYTI